MDTGELLMHAPSVDTPVPVTKPSAWSTARRWLLTEVVLQKWFDYLVLVVIAANCVTLALDQPLDDPASPKQRVLQVADKVGVAARQSVALCGAVAGVCVRSGARVCVEALTLLAFALQSATHCVCCRVRACAGATVLSGGVRSGDGD